MSSKEFRKIVWNYYKENGRHDLPWRKTTDPYKIMVSEVMLQQTQVPRVIEKYKEFLDAFPNVETLARSNLANVLKIWSGMGYNRRGKYLHDTAIEVVKNYKGEIPRDVVALRALPGIGPYSASAILMFAFNIPDILIETNVRAAFIHSFFKRRTYEVLISDKQLLPLIADAAEGQDPRTWHWALMDYGSHLKKLHKNPSRASAHYTKQSKFEGSLRQVRGAILRELHTGALSESSLYGKLNLSVKGFGKVKPSESSHRQRSVVRPSLRSGGSGKVSPKDAPERPARTVLAIRTVLAGSTEISKKRIKEALAGLERDGMIRKEGGKWRIA